MENHIYEWLNLLIRWIHFIVGVAWIGASFYFNWLENNLNRKPPQDCGIAGNLWALFLSHAFSGRAAYIHAGAALVR